MASAGRLTFPSGFRFGVATAAYQIEGAREEDGRGRSIWEDFEALPGRIERGEHAAQAADHYHRHAEDVRLMAELGAQVYRLSVAWPRVLPSGSGAPNAAGLDFYDRLVDELLAAGIAPMVTLYHWDLPSALQQRGGWAERDTAQALAELATVVAGRLSDRVELWVTQNEPFVTAIVGHLLGQHAPGVCDPRAACRAAHHLLLSHGLAAAALRASCSKPPQVGIALNLTPVYPLEDNDDDRGAAQRFDGLLNRLFLEPLVHGRYPADIAAAFGPLLADAVLPGDLAAIAAPLDFLGVNYYSRALVKHAPGVPFVQAVPVAPAPDPRGGREFSQMWEIFPEGLHELLLRLTREYGLRRLVISENGICVPDGLDQDGRVRDYRRIRYLRDHLAQIHRAISDGAGVEAYLVWSLLDNFEWGFGYRMRFGLVHVDFETQRRTIKDSGRWYAQVIRERGLELDAGPPFFPR